MKPLLVSKMKISMLLVICIVALPLPSALAATASQATVDGMAEDGYGVFVHWKWGSAVGPGATNIPVWNDRVTGFDVVDFADALEAGGAKWAIFSVVHVDNYVPFPLPLWESLLPGKTTTRDLLDDLYVELDSRGIDLWVYFGPVFMLDDFPGATEAEAIGNILDLLEAISLKYGDKIKGWWIDNLKPGHPFDLQALSDVLRSGNANTLIAFNLGGWTNGPAQIPNSADHQGIGLADYTSGHLLPVNLNFRRPAAQYDINGLLNQRSGKIDTSGSHWHYTGTNEAASYPESELLEYVVDMRHLGITCSWNLALYQDGTVSPTGKNVLKSLGAVMRQGFDYVPNTSGEIVYSANWDNDDLSDPAATDTGTARSSTTGSSATFTFDGGRAQIVGARTPSGGRYEAFLDGNLDRVLSTYGATDEHQVVLYDTGPLTYGQHTIEFKVRGTKVSASSGFDINLDHIFHMPRLDRVADDTDPAWSYDGGWVHKARYASYGGTISASRTTGAVATYTFTGDRFNIYTQYGPGTGIFDVKLDGNIVATIDTYSATGAHQKLAYSGERLLPGVHTVEIVVTGQSNPGATDNWVHVDMVEVTDTVPIGYEIDVLHYGIQYTGNWELKESEPALGDIKAVSKTASDTAAYEFSGTGIKVVGRKSPNGGICEIKIDGTLMATVDTYSSQIQDRVVYYDNQSLSVGNHHLEIVVTGMKRPGSGNTWISLDRIFVTP